MEKGKVGKGNGHKREWKGEKARKKEAVVRKRGENKGGYTKEEEMKERRKERRR